jgi:flagellar protein FlaJ
MDSVFKVTGIEPKIYLYKIALPLILATTLSGLVLYVFSGNRLGNFSSILLLLTLLGGFLAVLYPKLVLDKKRIEINQNLHWFITHIGTLSTAEVERVGIFEAIAKNKEYQELSRQAGIIVKLVKEFGLSLPEACKFQAKRCPSKVFASFLERLAYNIDAGQSLEDFLMREQDVLMNEFETLYINALKDTDIFKDLFLSMVLSIAFAVVFATVLPALTGTSPTLILAGTLVLFAIVESGFIYAIKMRVPKDPLWAKFDVKTEMEEKIDFYLPLSLIGVLILMIIDFKFIFGAKIPFTDLEVPLILALAIPLSPLILPGIISRKCEKAMKNRDKSFPSFIRSLGAAESARQTTTIHALRTLQRKDFGALTNAVRNLYRRLNMRVDHELSWRIFMRECGTFMIRRLSEMYLETRIKGGIAEKIGDLIARNGERIIALRMRRSQTTTTLIGVLYGITASLSFALFIGVKIIDIMGKSLVSAELSGNLEAINVINLQLYNIPLVNFMISLILIIHSMLSAIMIKVVDGGHQVNGYFHFVVMVWISAVSALLTDIGLGGVVNI